ncbi:MAG: hypothetical protein J4N95_06520 [Chloroflexi bacterium]|nr:hypothetical protein [Chloroflexota bacterium]MCI0856206.1 hypothetical protein [Chloroflexota bacterium]MCI0889577.1 hypothetical protein [Chloroflexota bacterium]
MSSFARPAFALLVPLLAVIAALAFVSAQQFSATATETVSGMKLQIAGKAASCDSFENPTKCSIQGGQEFTIAVAVESLPAGASGYIGFQTLLYYGELRYKPNADIGNEIVWPDSALPVRSPGNPGGEEGIVGHGSVSSLTPPLVVSTYLGNVMQLRATCTETAATFPLVLIAYNAAEQPLGTGFRLSDEDGGLTVAAKSTGQAVLDLDGNPKTDAQTVDVASRVEINCAGPTATPIPPAPDLVVQSMQVTLETGGACNFTSTTLGIRVFVENVGPIDAGPFAVEVNGAQQTVAAGLESGMKASLWFSGYVNGENTAIVDAADQIDEMNEANNSVTQILPVPTLPLSCTPTPTLTPTATPVGVSGDVNCSGAVTSIDAALILQFTAALTDSLPCEHLADVNSNGSVDAIDATLVLQFVAGLIGSL